MVYLLNVFIFYYVLKVRFFIISFLGSNFYIRIFVGRFIMRDGILEKIVETLFSVFRMWR